ncbi:MAG: hypothetical protein EZS28_036349 [Streblomastix strix]|uniref:Uncharacterized protein n=1 Tax=Streblomastix strix TaxID=222440 RepID=A0A5J4UET4_9EUKA|nr:MAG: hypothetical protein EZS28_036349 [Streblomastix strix]
MGSRSRKKNNIRNPIDCVFPTGNSVIVIEPESYHTTQSLFQLTPLIVDAKLIIPTIPHPIYWITNTIPNLSNLVSNYSTIEPIFTNDDSTVNTNKRTPITEQRKYKRLTKPVSTGSTMGPSYNINKLKTEIEHINNQKYQQSVNSTNTGISIAKTSRVPLLPYTTEINQQQRQSKRQTFPKHKRTDESGEDDIPDEIIPGISMPHLPPHKSDMETAQRTWQNRGYDLVRDPGVIKYQNSKWYSKLATQKPFTFRDWREIQSDVDFSLEQINIPHYLQKEYKSQSPQDQTRRNESIRIYEREREQAIENGKEMKRKRLIEANLEAEVGKKQSKNSRSNSRSSSSSDDSQQIQGDWTSKWNTTIP